MNQWNIATRELEIILVFMIFFQVCAGLYFNYNILTELKNFDILGTHICRQSVSMKHKVEQYENRENRIRDILVERASRSIG